MCDSYAVTTRHGIPFISMVHVVCMRFVHFDICTMRYTLRKLGILFMLCAPVGETAPFGGRVACYIYITSGRFAALLFKTCTVSPQLYLAARSDGVLLP